MLWVCLISSFRNRILQPHAPLGLLPLIRQSKVGPTAVESLLCPTSDRHKFSLSGSSHRFFPPPPGSTAVKNPPANAGDTGDSGLIPGLGISPGGGRWQSTPIFLPRKFHGWRSHKECQTRQKTHVPNTWNKQNDYDIKFNSMFWSETS